MAAFVILLVLLVVTAFVFMGIIALWVYRDAKERGDRGWMWVSIILLSSPILGGLLYLIARREERYPCRFCGWMINKTANYCEHCGKQFPVCEPGSGYLEDLPLNERKNDSKRRNRNRRFLMAMILSAVMMVASLVGLIVVAVNGGDADIGIDWNTGWVMMNVENTWDNVWTFRYNKASEGYHVDSRLKVENPQTQQLAVDLSFGEGQEMLMKISQQREDGRTIEQEVYLDSSSQTRYFELGQFEDGKIKISIYNNGVSDVSGKVTVLDKQNRKKKKASGFF